jgi:hypothetical protein
MLMGIMVRLVLFVDVDKGSRVRLFVLAYVDRGYILGLLYSLMWIRARGTIIAIIR